LDTLQVLETNYTQIYGKIYNYYVHSKAYDTCPDRDKESALSYFSDELYTRLNRVFPKFKIPCVINTDYDIISDFVFKFLSYEYKYAVLNVLQKFRRKIATKEILFCEIDELTVLNFQREFQDDESAEENLESIQILDHLKYLNDTFFFMLNTTEQIIFKGILEGQAYSDVAKEIGKFKYGRNPSKMDISRLRNIIEFRLLCHYGFYRFFTEGRILKGLNIKPFLCKKYFGQDNLVKIPSLADLHEVALGDFERFPLRIKIPYGKKSYEIVDQRAKTFDPNAVLVECRRDFRWKSKKSLNGKIHKTYKTYINSSSYAYDHTTQEYGMIDETGYVLERLKVID
jgi:hypothetical protein